MNLYSILFFIRHLSYTTPVPIDYMQMLLDLMEERQQWIGRRDEAIREISRLSELIRATMNMVPPEKLARYEPIFERIEQRPAGLSLAVRTCFTKGKEWMTPVEIRDSLKSIGFPFENYKANPLASIHTTLKRMVPAEVEMKTLKDGQKVYRLKSAGEWKQAFSEAREWMRSHYSANALPGGGVVVVKKRAQEKPDKEEAEKRGQSKNKEDAQK